MSETIRPNPQWLKVNSKTGRTEACLTEQEMEQELEKNEQQNLQEENIDTTKN